MDGRDPRGEGQGEPLRSVSNPKVQRVRAAVKGREEGVLLLEGDRLVDEALGLGLELELLLVADDRPERLAELEAAGRRPIAVEAGLLDRIGSLKSGPGILALAAEPEVRPVGELTEALGDAEAGSGPPPLVLVVAGVADPVNLGALARSAEAAGVRALVRVAGGVSPWNPRALRGSMGSLLRLPVLEAPDEAAAAEACVAAGLTIASAATRGGEDFRTFDWTRPVALWIGPELGGTMPGGAVGLTIPMAGAVESLNVTVAASVLLFAAGRTGGGA